MTTNRQKSKLIRDAVDNAGTSLDEHCKAREVIVGNLIQTKIPIVKICDKHIRVDENDPAPYELSKEAKEIFKGIADAIESSKQADLSDTADVLALWHDISLLP